MNRFDRITSILIQLQSKRVIKAQEIADRFKISLRTVYRDIRTLEEAGVPLFGEAGVGYSLTDGYRLPPIQFTREEATAFLVTEKIVEKYTDRDNSEKYNSALYKIKAVLRSTEKEYLDEVDKSITSFKNSHTINNQNNYPLQEILAAIKNKNEVFIQYKKSYATESTSRTIEPIGIYEQNNQWYLIAYCQLKKDYRNFRLDRLTGFQRSEKTFLHNHPSLSDYLQQITFHSELISIEIEIEKRVAPYIITQKYYYGFVSEVEQTDTIRMTFLSASADAFARWYLMLAANARIISPPEIKDKVKSLVTEITHKLD